MAAGDTDENGGGKGATEAAADGERGAEGEGVEGSEAPMLALADTNGLAEGACEPLPPAVVEGEPLWASRWGSSLALPDGRAERKWRGGGGRGRAGDAPPVGEGARDRKSAADPAPATGDGEAPAEPLDAPEALAAAESCVGGAGVWSSVGVAGAVAAALRDGVAAADAEAVAEA